MTPKNIAAARKVLLSTAVLGLGLLIAEARPASADPPPHAKAHGWRRKNEGSDYRTRDYRSRRDWDNDRYDDDRWSGRRYSGDRYRYGTRSSDYGRYSGPVRTRVRTRTNDHDLDGIPNSRDRDIDGDGVRNDRDRHPRDPRRR